MKDTRILNGYKVLTIRGLLNLSEDELKNVLSVCWRNGRLRTDTIGIKNVSFSYGVLSYSDYEGYEDVFTNLSEIDTIEITHGEWSYGLYIKIN